MAMAMMTKLQDFIKMVLEAAPEATEITFSVEVTMVGRKFVYVETYNPSGASLNRLTFTIRKNPTP